MATDTRSSSTSTSVGGGGALEPRTRRKGKWIVLAILFLVVLPLAAFALWTTIALSYAYSRGERAGFVQKLSQRGWVCKTYEGEMALANGPNVVPEIFRFTVRDPKIADAINASLGRQVKVIYEQHKFVPTSCFGETEYFVKEVIPIGLNTTVPTYPGAPAPGELPNPQAQPTAAPSTVPAPAGGAPAGPATPAP